MPPAVAPASEVWRTAPSVSRERRRYLGHPKRSQRSLRDHLAGELHSRSAKAETKDGVAPEATHAAVEIPYGTTEEQSSHRGQDRVAEIAVQGRHRARSDAALKSIAHHKVETLAKLDDERLQAGQVVAVVGIRHDHESAAGCLDAALKRGAV